MTGTEAKEANMSDARKLADELLPCPFCGGEARCNGLPNGVMGQIYCIGEECFGPRTTALTKQDSIVQWNTRAALSPSPQPSRQNCGADGVRAQAIEECAKVVDRWISDITKAGDQFDKGGDIYSHANVCQGVASAIRALSPAGQPVAADDGTR